MWQRKQSYTQNTTSFGASPGVYSRDRTTTANDDSDHSHLMEADVVVYLFLRTQLCHSIHLFISSETTMRRDPLKNQLSALNVV